MPHMKILKLQVENVKKLKAALIEPDPKAATVVLTGDNMAGKSCALDAIQWGLQGPKALPPDPVRHGEDKARVQMKLGDPGDGETTLDITRTVDTKGKGTLTIKDTKGSRLKAPQGLLDRIYGSRTFDPGEFALLAKTAEGRQKQVTILEGLVDFDFDEAAKERKSAFDERQIVNRELKRLTGALAELPDVGDEPVGVDVSDLTAKLEEAETTNTEHARKRRMTTEKEAACGRLSSDLTTLGEEIYQLKKAFAAKDVELGDAAKKHKEMVEATKGLKDVDSAALRAQINAASETNAEVVRHKHVALDRERLGAEAEAKRKTANMLTDAMCRIDRAKKKALEDAKLPVPGMTFDADGVSLDGIPFEQASTSEAIRVSVLMGIHLNPQLKIMLVRDGNAFDKKHRPILAQIAEEAGVQLWIEEHDSNDPAAIVIEEGAVAGA